MRRRTKRRNQKRTQKRKYKVKRIPRKTRGGFFTGASYLFDQGMSIFQVPPPTPYGNPSLPVNPFPYVQTK